MLGQQFLHKEFGVASKIGWNMRAPGQSSTNARLFAQLGFEAQFFTRLDDELKIILMRKENPGMNFMWQPQARHFGDKYQILTGVLDGFGCSPEGQFYDLGQAGQEREVNDPFVDDGSLRDFNAD